MDRVDSSQLQHLLLLVFVTAVLASGGGTCLRLMRVVVPHYKVKGDPAVLECLYELQGDSLYSVKWYKENEEFYRFVPKSNPQQQSYKVDGIRVDHTRSDSKRVVLRTVNLKSSGVYRCEVSAEGPSFASVQSEAHMQVIYIPSNGPHITGEERQYQVGEMINLNCTSGKSFPASQLHWYINDRQVRDPRLLRPYEIEVHAHGLVSTTLGLLVRVSPKHFVAGSMKLRCTASISPVMWQGDRESVVERAAPLLLDNKEALFLVKGGAGRPMGAWLVPSLLILLLT